MQAQFMLVIYVLLGLSRGVSGKNPPGNAGDTGDMKDLLVWEDPPDRACRITPVFLPKNPGDRGTCGLQS